MKLKGRYVKDEIVEIPRGDGITELIRIGKIENCEPVGLQYFQWEKKKEVKKKRSNRTWVTGSAILAAFVMGATFGGLVEHLWYCAPAFIISLSYLALVCWVNREVKK